MDFLGGLAAKVKGTPSSYEDVARSNPILQQLAVDAAMNKLVTEDRPLVDSSLDMVPLGSVVARAAGAVDKAAVTAANKVPVYMYDPDTYKGLAKGIIGKKPVDVSSFDKWAKVNPERSDPEKYAGSNRYFYDRMPSIGGYFEPSTLQYAAKNNASMLHELKHVDDYLSGKPSGSSPEAMQRVVEKMGTYAYPEEHLDKISWRLYQGNLGERAANKAASNRYMENPTPELEWLSRMSIKDLESRSALIDRIEGIKDASESGIANTITEAGLANKRNLLGYSPYYSKLRPTRSKNVPVFKAGLASSVTTPGMEYSADKIKEFGSYINDRISNPEEQSYREEY